MKLWSMSTTVRNPERLRNFLKVLKILEGQPFNQEIQKKYQILLIHNKYYIPTNISSNFQKYYKEPDKLVPLMLLKRFFIINNIKTPQ